MSNPVQVVNKLRTGDVVEVRSRVYEASPEAELGAKSAPAGTQAQVVTIWANGIEMYPNPAPTRKGESMYRDHTKVAIIQFYGDDGEYWQADVNVNALKFVRRPRRLQS